MTEVFLAREKGATSREGLVVVHRVLSSVAENADFVEAFLNEAGAAGTIKHPNIVEIYDLGETEGQAFVAEEYVPGGSLHELLDRLGDERMSLGDALSIVGEVCSGLQFAHAMAGPDGMPRNLVHGALNPRHILVSTDGMVKVADFGMNTALALLNDPPRGADDNSEAFLAPEQRQSRGVDRRADIYACGALLYRLVTGECPGFPEDSSFRRPREVDPDVPEVVEQIILKAMAEQPKDRHPTCGAIRRDIYQVSTDLRLAGDMSSLGVLVRAQFPEALAPDDDIEPRLNDSQDGGAPPKQFPAPEGDDVFSPATSNEPKDDEEEPLATSPAPRTPISSSPLVSARIESDEIPMLSDTEVQQISTGQYDALKTEKVESLLDGQADEVLAGRDSPSPAQVNERGKRPILLWIAVAAVGGAVLATVAVLAVVFIVLTPSTMDSGEDLSLGEERAVPVTEPPPSPTPALSPNPVSPPVPAAASGAAPDPNAADPNAAGAKPPGTTDPNAAAMTTPSPGEEQPPATDQGSGESTSSPPDESTRPTKTAPSTRPESGANTTKNQSTSQPPVKRSRRAGSKGSLYVLTSPTSRVYLDSRLLGTTPIMNHKVSAGRHSLVLVSPGFSPKRLSVRVQPSKATRVRHLFNR